MSNDVYIVAAKRTAICKAIRGGFAKKRPDELLAENIAYVVKESKINPEDIEDVIIGCAFPEAEQGLNVARVSAMLAGLPDTVPGITINRYCSSGLNSIAMAADTIASGKADVLLAGGVESMSMVPMGGNNWSVSPEIFKNDENVAIAFGMGITAENVAKEWGINRISQDEFALESNKRATNAINNNYFKDEILPIKITHRTANENNLQIQSNESIIDTDECPRSDTSIEALSKLKSVFATNGTVTAGNSSQMSDGSACLILVSEKYLKQHSLKPLGKFLGFSVVGVPARIMGIGPIHAVQKVLSKTGLKIDDIDLIELNEAFAAQSLAVIKDLKLNTSKVNPYGGAIAFGHPLGATGAILSTKILYALRRNKQKYGMVTMCIGNGMGAAGIFECL